MKLVFGAMLAAASFFSLADEKPPQRIFSETAEQKPDVVVPVVEMFL